MNSISCFLSIKENLAEVAILLAYILLTRSASLELINLWFDINQITVAPGIYKLTSTNPRSPNIFVSL